MHIAIAGTGYVGLVTGACLAEFGMHVTCVDKEVEKIEALLGGRIPIYEPGLDVLVQKNVAQGRLSFTTDLRSAVDAALVIFIAVGTPPGDGGAADLSAVRRVAADIGSFMTGYKVIVNKSTVPVGTGQLVKKLVREHQERPLAFDVVSNPEFLREGAAISDFMRPDRVVIGTESDHAAAIMKDIYRVLYINETPFVVTNLETAELIKYAANAFLATKVTFINEVANLCEAVGANVQHVARGIGLDGRIGRKFLHPGPGFGGSCFPKDTRAFARIGRDAGEPLGIVEAVIDGNHRQKERMVGKIEGLLDDRLEGRVIGVLGLAFKPETDDVREAPALAILPTLAARGARLRIYDPAAQETFMAACPGLEVTACSDAYEVAAGAHALVLMTEWNQFRHLDMERIKQVMAKPVFADLKNVYERDKLEAMGFRYAGVGR